MAAAGSTTTIKKSTTAQFLRRLSSNSLPRLHSQYANRPCSLHASLLERAPTVRLRSIRGRSWSSPLCFLIIFALQTLFSFRPPLEDIRCDDMYEQFYESAQVSLCGGFVGGCWRIETESSGLNLEWSRVIDESRRRTCRRAGCSILL